jgi:hypothetical protein
MDRQALSDRSYSHGRHYSRDRQPSVDGQHSLNWQPSMRHQQSTARQQSIHQPQHTADHQYSIDHGYPPERQHSTGSQSSRMRQESPELHYSQSMESYELQSPPSPILTRPLKPLNPLPYPVPAMRSYQDFNDFIYKYQIHVSRPKVIKRLRTVAASDGPTRGYFPDTGLTGVDQIDRDFDSIHYTLIYTENLVEPIVGPNHSRIYSSTFGVIGQSQNDGQWKVRCWIQPSASVAKEIQLMVKEALLTMGQVVKKYDRSGYKGPRLSARMSIQEHESIWNLIHEWDSEMRAMWRDRFQ